jgi:hypothetical protein
MAVSLIIKSLGKVGYFSAPLEARVHGLCTLAEAKVTDSLGIDASSGCL